jgi:hypothetical protein
VLVVEQVLRLVSWLVVSFSVQLMVGKYQSCFFVAFLWAAYLSIINLQEIGQLG